MLSADESYVSLRSSPCLRCCPLVARFVLYGCPCANEGKWESREHDNNANGMEKIHRGWKKKWPMQDRVKRLKVMLSQWQTRSIMFVAVSVLTLGFVPDDV